MLLISGHAGGTDLTGTLYERGEHSPSFKGAPDDEAPYIWVCDAFYEVESGGQRTEIGGRELNVAFESPMPHGFETREKAIDAAKEHIRTQFARVGLDAADVDVDVAQAEPEAQ